MSGAVLINDTVFTTGGSSGIGAGLATALHVRGAKVIIGGRDRASLERHAQAHTGMEIEVIDVSDPESVLESARRLGLRHPALNVVVNNAGIQRLLDFAGDQVRPEQVDAEIDTNLKGSIYVVAAFLPILRRQASARLVNVTSGLGFVPLVKAPI